MGADSAASDMPNEISPGEAAGVGAEVEVALVGGVTGIMGPSDLTEDGGEDVAGTVDASWFCGTWCGERQDGGATLPEGGDGGCGGATVVIP